MYENDPNRLNRPPIGDPVEGSAATGIVTVALIAALFMALGLVFWPSERTATTVTENAPRVERPIVPADPPATKPITPAPSPPQ